MILEALRQVNVKDLPWEPHPFIRGIEIKVLLSHQRDNADMTILMVRAPKGVEIPAHIHEGQDDIVYTLQGRSKMWVEGAGDFPLEPGSFIRIPKGVKHQPQQAEEEVLAFDIFYPYLF